VDLSEPIVFMTVSVNVRQWGRLYDDFLIFLFLYVHRETSVLVGKLSEKSDQFRFLCSTCLANFKVSVGLILPKASVMRILIVSLTHTCHCH